MKNKTRELYNSVLAQIAKLNGVPSVVSSFSVAPSVQQKLEDIIQETDDFLKLINFIVVDEMKGEKVGVGVSRPIASNTKTPERRRQGIDVLALDAEGYECRKNNFDTLIRYSTLDQWARFKDFALRLRNAIVKRQGLDILTMGFNGTSYADNTDFASNPLLQDVNIGWLQKIRLAGVAHHLDGVEVGATKEIKNIDALVMDALNSYIARWNQKDPSLRVLCSPQFLQTKYYGLVNQEQKPTEQVASKILSSQYSIGGLPPITVPFFPDNAFLITSTDNLSRYVQDGGRRRYIKDDPEIDAIQNFESSNDAYVVEDMDKAAFVEHIVIS